MPNPLTSIADDARAALRAEAAKGARDEVQPLVLLALGVALLALYTATKRRGRR